MTVLLSVHQVTYWLAFAAIVVAAVAAWIPRVASRSVVLAGALYLATGAISAGARWAVTGHPPIFGTFENTVAASWAVAAAATWLLARRRSGDDPVVPRLLYGWGLALLAYGLFFSRTPLPLTISERSVMIDIHVLFAWASFAALLTSSMAGVARIVRRSPVTNVGNDAMVLRGLGLGFALLTTMIAVGSAYSYILFGDWYRWELVGASTMAAWLGYASSLHAHLMFGWRGRKLAWCAVAMLPLLLLVFWSWSVFSGTYHYFDLSVIRAR